MIISVPNKLIDKPAKAQYIISLFIDSQERQLNSTVLMEKLGKTYAKFVKDLINQNILSITSNHLASVKSRTYRLADEHFNCQWVNVRIPDKTIRKRTNINKFITQQQNDLNKACFNPAVYDIISKDDKEKMSALNTIIQGKAKIGQDTFSSRSYGPHTVLSHSELLYMTVDNEKVAIADMSASIIACLFGALIKTRTINQEMLNLRRYLENGLWDQFGWTDSERKKNKKTIITQLNIPIKQYMGCLNNPDSVLSKMSEHFPILIKEVIPTLKRRHGDNVISAMFMRLETSMFDAALKALQSKGIWAIRHHDSIIVKESDKEELLIELKEASLKVLKVNAKIKVDILPDNDNITYSDTAIGESNGNLQELQEREACTRLLQKQEQVEWSSVFLQIMSHKEYDKSLRIHPRRSAYLS